MKNVTVTMPLAEFDRLREAAAEKDVSTTRDEDFKYTAVLIEDVVSGEVSMSEAPGFIFFQTRVGKIVLENIGLFKK